MSRSRDIMVVGHRGWRGAYPENTRAGFEAADCYEKASSFDLSAKSFERFTTTFPKSKLIEKAYVRSAENYKKVNNLAKAAEVYVAAANKITKAEYAIPSLSAASDCYNKIERFDLAGKMFEMIYQRTW